MAEFIGSIQTWPQTVTVVGVAIAIGATAAWCMYCLHRM
jgi:hypothetical protein